METAIFIAAMLTLFLGKPRLRYSVPTDGSYMSHDRTMMINGIFLVLIVLKHTCGIGQIVGYEPEGIDLVLKDCLIMPLRQFIIATFFFYSGYGIMCSIRKRGDAYIHDLLCVRFLRLYLNLAVAMLVVYAISPGFFQHPLGAAKDYLLNVLGLTPNYAFIIVTLALYLLTWVSFRVCGTQRPWLAIGTFFCLTMAFCLAILPYKPQFWVDMLPCFVGGTAYCMLQQRIDRMLSGSRMPVSLLGAAAVAVAMVGITHIPACNYYISQWLHIDPDAHRSLHFLLLTQAFAIPFAVGVTWFFAGITWQRVPAFLKWFGGPAVFSVYCWHFTPIIQFCRMGLNSSHPSLYVLAVFLCAILLGWLGIRFFKAVDHVFWPKTR